MQTVSMEQPDTLDLSMSGINVYNTVKKLYQVCEVLRSLSYRGFLCCLLQDLKKKPFYALNFFFDSQAVFQFKIGYLQIKNLLRNRNDEMLLQALNVFHEKQFVCSNTLLSNPCSNTNKFNELCDLFIEQNYVTGGVK